MVISILIKPIQHDLHLTDTQFSLAQGVAFAASFALCAIPLGIAIDRYSRRHIVFICVLAWGSGLHRRGVRDGPDDPDRRARDMLGLGEAVLAPAAASLIGDNFPDNRAGTALGIFGASVYVGYGVSLTVGGGLIAFLGARGGLHLPLVGTLAPWRATFVVVGLPAFALAFLAFFMNDPRAAANGVVTKRGMEVGWTELLITRRGALAGHLVGISALTGVFLDRGGLDAGLSHSQIPFAPRRNRAHPGHWHEPIGRGGKCYRRGSDQPHGPVGHHQCCIHSRHRRRGGQRTVVHCRAI